MKRKRRKTRIVGTKLAVACEVDNVGSGGVLLYFFNRYGFSFKFYRMGKTFGDLFDLAVNHWIDRVANSDDQCALVFGGRFVQAVVENGQAWCAANLDAFNKVFASRMQRGKR